LPGIEARLPDVRADRGRLARYASVCGFAMTERLPPTYPHVLAFPATMALLTRRDFPLPLLGLVHVGNRIVMRRPIDAAEPLSLYLRAADLRPHPAGAAFDVVTIASDRAGEVVWESVGTYLRRDPDRPRREAAPAPNLLISTLTAGDPADATVADWDVPGNTGRRYAAVSGDRNPIHLSAPTARMFGFRTAIAHGMWTKARILAALEPELPPAYTVDVTFRAPVPLPSTVRLTSNPEGKERGICFTLGAPDGARIHLDGTVAFEC
jgi:acyl dehydratase